MKCPGEVGIKQPYKCVCTLTACQNEHIGKHKWLDLYYLTLSCAVHVCVINAAIEDVT